VTAALLVVAALSYFGPEALPTLFGGTRAAWQYVLNGVEASFLWAFVFAFVPRFEARAIAAWAMFEAMQRPVCRLAFPMDRAPDLGGAVGLCDAAFGVPMSALSVVAALALAAVAQESSRARKTT
jgi:hypothetical protein